MDKKRLTNLIKRPEGPKLDFKQIIDIVTESGRKEIAKDVCAIANSKGGRGYIIVGIEDKTKRVTGIGSLDISEEQIQQIITSRSEPPIPISLELIEYDGKRLGIINIYDGPQKPYQIRENGAFYIRRGSTNDTMRKEEIIEALQESFSVNSEVFPIVNSNADSINFELVKLYFASKHIEVNEKNKYELMVSTSILYVDKESERQMATMAGLLVFSDINYIYFPHNFIRIVNKIDGAEKNDIIIQGDLLSMIDKSEIVLKETLPKYYPAEAVFEAVMNAVVYRDYTIQSREIQVIIDKNSVSVISPGVLAETQNAVNNNYNKRNMWIYEKLLSMDPKGRFLKSEKGFNKMKKLFKNSGRILFVNNINENSFKVIFPGINKLKRKNNTISRNTNIEKIF